MADLLASAAARPPRDPLFVGLLAGFRRYQVDTIGDDLAIALYFGRAERGYRCR
jgi:hypothetical protein